MSQPEAKVEVYDDDEVIYVLALKGEMGFPYNSKIQEAFDQISRYQQANPDKTYLVIDLSQITYLDGNCFGVILKGIAAFGQRTAFVKGPRPALLPFIILNLIDRLPFFEDKDAALNHISQVSKFSSS